MALLKTVAMKRKMNFAIEHKPLGSVHSESLDTFMVKCE